MELARSAALSSTRIEPIFTSYTERLEFGPDSTVNPADQVAFYDPGLGSAADGGRLHGGIIRWIYNKISEVTGLGITANIVDCYAALIRLWRPGDRIFLFGFSRGAYTIRCLAAVIAKCGVPTRDCGGGPLKLDVASTQKVAGYAVKHVYQFTSSRPASEASFVQLFLLETRELLAKRFRSDYGSADTARPELANIYPYFIGAFDTVAAVGSFAKTALLTLAFLIVIALVSACLSTLSLLGGIPAHWPATPAFHFLVHFYGPMRCCIFVLSGSICLHSYKIRFTNSRISLVEAASDHSSDDNMATVLRLHTR